MDRKKAINIINNYNGVFALTYEDKHEFDRIKIPTLPTLIYTDNGIEIMAERKFWYEDGESGIVKFQILNKVEII